MTSKQFQKKSDPAPKAQEIILAQIDKNINLRYQFYEDMLKFVEKVDGFFYLPKNIYKG